jgi:hypothetical protein
VTDAVLTSIIGASGAVVGALVGATVPQFFARADSRKRFVSSQRETAIPGLWNGAGEDFFTEDHSPGHSFTLRLHLETKQARVSGKGELNDSVQLALEGGFYSDSYLQFTYRSVDPSRMQLGVIVFRLSGEGDILAGHYAGLSPTRNIFVAGKVSLKRVAAGS